MPTFYLIIIIIIILSYKGHFPRLCTAPPDTGRRDSMTSTRRAPTKAHGGSLESSPPPAPRRRTDLSPSESTKLATLLVPLAPPKAMKISVNPLGPGRTPPPPITPPHPNAHKPLHCAASSAGVWAPLTGGVPLPPEMGPREPPALGR
jgi:hypothetical protein